MFDFTVHVGVDCQTDDDWECQDCPEDYGVGTGCEPSRAKLSVEIEIE